MICSFKLLFILNNQFFGVVYYILRVELLLITSLTYFYGMEVKLYPELASTIEALPKNEISIEQKRILDELVKYIQLKQNNSEPINLNFICTHNSRRSQFAQLWAHVAAEYYGIPVNCFSGGVEETAFNERAVAAIKRAGFKVTSQGEENPRYSISFADNTQPIIMFSKLYDDAGNPSTDFTAVMTCSDADENCPYIPGAESRIQLLYDDPKEYDGTPEEAEKYDERARQIAAELFYVFSQISK
jgi:arsenate reductase